MRRSVLAFAAALAFTAAAVQPLTVHAAESNQGCTYAGKGYSNGAIIQFSNYDLRCDNGSWTQVNKPGSSRTAPVGITAK